jgi:hypothetical protein
MPALLNKAYRASCVLVDLISDALPFGRLCYAEPNAVSNAIGYALHRSRAHRALIHVYDDAGTVMETQEHDGEFKSSEQRQMRKTASQPSHRHRTTGENDANDGLLPQCHHRCQPPIAQPALRGLLFA